MRLPIDNTDRLLFLTSPELAGADVRELQTRLVQLGYKPGAIDAEYGPATVAAVRTLEREHGLTVDGIVGPDVRAALKAERPKIAPTLPGRTSPGLAALEWMRTHVGMKEAPPNSNRCPITEEFRLIGPWCAMAVSLAFKHGAGRILGDGPGPAPAGYWDGRGFAYVPSLEAWLKTAGYWRGHTTPARGMIVLYDWNGDGEPDHVGIVDADHGDGRFTALEGNTGIGADSDGGELMERDRYVNETAGFAWVTWHA